MRGNCVKVGAVAGGQRGGLWVAEADVDDTPTAIVQCNHDTRLLDSPARILDDAGDMEKDLLSITAVHPMRQEAVSDFLARAGTDWSLVRRLIAQGHSWRELRRAELHHAEVDWPVRS